MKIQKKNKRLLVVLQKVSVTSKVTQGDVIVFNSTWKKNFILVKRCIGLPRDRLEIKEAVIFRNDTTYAEPNTVKKNIVLYDYPLLIPHII